MSEDEEPKEIGIKEETVIITKDLLRRLLHEHDTLLAEHGDSINWLSDKIKEILKSPPTANKIRVFLLADYKGTGTPERYLKYEVEIPTGFLDELRQLNNWLFQVNDKLQAIDNSIQ